MKVIKKGKPWTKKVTCTGNGNGGAGCGAELEIEKEDIFVTSSQAYRDSPEYYYTITCPECKTKTDITGLPKAVEEFVDKKRK